MSLGDVLEIVAGVVLVAAVLLIVGPTVSWLVGVGAGLFMLGLVLGYEAQVWAGVSFSVRAKKNAGE